MLPDVKLDNNSQINSIKKLQFRGHKSDITSLSLIKLDKKRILTAGLDQYVCIWTLDGVQLAVLNVNQPLPQKWEIKFDDYAKISK